MEKIQLWYIREYPQSYLYSSKDPSLNLKAALVHVPKSLIEHRSKDGNRHIVTLPSWFVQKENL